MSNTAYDKFLELKDNGLIGDRDGQEIYVAECGEAIDDKKILFEQAGVGMGKTKGYLIPIMDALMKGKVKRVVISTTTFELQEQIKNEVKELSIIMGYPAKVGILKGKKNYACAHLVQQLSDEQKEGFGNVSREHIEAICDSITDFSVSDRDKLIDKEIKKLDRNVKELLQEAETEEDRIEILNWQKSSIESIILAANYVVELCNVHKCRPVNCGLSMVCTFTDIADELKDCEIVITNHYKLTSVLRNLTVKNVHNFDTRLIEEADMFVVDEAHQLESAIRSGCQEELDFNTLQSCIFSIQQISYKTRRGKEHVEHKKLRESDQRLTDKQSGLIWAFVKALKQNASQNFNSKEQHIKLKKFDCDKLALDLSDPNISRTIVPLINELQNFLQLTRQFIKDMRGDNIVKSCDDKIAYILNALKQLKEFSKYENSDNIYWIRYTNYERAVLVSTPKDIKPILEPIFRKDSSNMVPVIMTSGTMDTGNYYSFIIESLGLTDRYKIGSNDGDVIANDPIGSPFPYDKNSVCYVDDTAPTPKVKNKKELEEYYDEIAERVANLIMQTNGNALVLFTNINDLNEIYKRTLKLIDDETIKNNIINQKANIDRISAEHLKKEGTSLFATGSFWQGIDIKGHALSNVIVVKLPFPSLDPIVDYKISLLANSSESEFVKKKKIRNFIKDCMLNQLCQAAGRLIRDKDDKGIFVILDPRAIKYWDDIKKVLPFVNVTTKLSEVRNFIINNSIDKSPDKKTIKK